MLINLSNHPVNTWQENQKKIAESNYGEIIDLQFPLIPPEEGLDYVKYLANKYLVEIEKILNKGRNYSNENNAVHIMGELTFVYVLLELLKAKGIKAVASTTRRNVVETQEGKLSKFEFVRFREYY